MNTSTYLLIEYQLSIMFLMAFLLTFIKRRYTLKISMIIAGVVIIMIDVMDFMRIIAWKEVAFSVFVTIVEIVIVQIAAMILSEYRDFRALFTGFSASIFVLVGNIMGTIAQVETGRIVFAVIVQFVVYIGLFILLKVRILEKYKHMMQEKSIAWGRLCFIPAILYVLAYSIITWPASIFESPQNVLAGFLIVIAIVIVYLMVFYVTFEVQQLAEVTSDREYLESYLKRLKNEVQMREKMEQKMSVYRHDMRHYTRIMAAYIKEKDYGKMENVLKEVNGFLESAHIEKYCENIAVNGVLASCMNIAERKKVKLECMAQIPKELKIKEYEFAAMISNLVENAVLAAAKVKDTDNRYVKFEAKRTDMSEHSFILEVKNTYAEEIQISSETGLPISSGGQNHGIGMRSVELFAEKYNAIFSYETRDDMFYARMFVRI